MPLCLLNFSHRLHPEGLISKYGLLIFLLLTVSACTSARKSNRLETTLLQNLTPVPLTSWRFVYDGGGKIETSPQGGLLLETSVPRSPQHTHAALVLYAPPAGAQNFVVVVEFTNKKQLRPQSPNDWEVFWLFTNYRLGLNGKKTANYLLVKPRTGVELGKVYDEAGQDFLYTDSSVTLPLNRRAQLVVQKKGPHLKAWLNGRQIVDHRGGEGAWLYDEPGEWGLYSEDAEVEIHSFAYKVL